MLSSRKCDYVNLSSKLASVHLYFNGTGKVFMNGRVNCSRIKDYKIKCFNLFFKILSVDCFIYLKSKKHLKRSNLLLYQILKKIQVYFNYVEKNFLHF